jgi:hypothetical protein
MLFQRKEKNRVFFEWTRAFPCRFRESTIQAKQKRV